MSYSPYKTFADQGLLDAFQNVRSAGPTFVADGQMTYDAQPILYAPITSGTGATATHDATDRCGLLTFSDTPTGGEAYFQSYEYHRYQSGRAQEIFITFNLIESVANCLKFVGYSDGVNGIEFQNNGSVNQLVVYSATGNGNQTVTQANWNVDKLDGNGASGITLDITKTQIFVIDIQALYVGRVRCGFDIDGTIVWVHEFLHANRAASPYIQSANLPIRCGMTCTGTVSTTVKFICSTVLSRGGQDDVSGYSFAVEGTGTAGNAANVPILTIRPALLFNSITNRVKVSLEGLEFIVTGANPVRWTIYRGSVFDAMPTVTYSSVDLLSSVEYGVGGSLFIAGTPIQSGYCAASNQVKASASYELKNRYPFCLNPNGTNRPQDYLTVAAYGIGGTSACRAILKWREVR